MTFKMATFWIKTTLASFFFESVQLNEDMKRECITVATDRFLLRSSSVCFVPSVDQEHEFVCVRGFHFLMLSSAKTVTMDTPLVYFELLIIALRNH